MRRYLALDLPPPVRDLRIKEYLEKRESQVDIRVGVLPFEILTDKARLTI